MHDEIQNLEGCKDSEIKTKKLKKKKQASNCNLLTPAQNTELDI